MKQALQRERCKTGYKQPVTLINLAKYIFQNNYLKDILKGKVQVGEDIALIFSSKPLLERLNKEKEVYMDGTFKVKI